MSQLESALHPGLHLRLHPMSYQPFHSRVVVRCLSATLQQHVAMHCRCTEIGLMVTLLQRLKQPNFVKETSEQQGWFK